MNKPDYLTPEEWNELEPQWRDHYDRESQKWDEYHDKEWMA